MASPALERLARQFAGQVKLVKVNVSEARQTAAPEPARRNWLEQALSVNAPH